MTEHFRGIVVYTVNQPKYIRRSEVKISSHGLQRTAREFKLTATHATCPGSDAAAQTTGQLQRTSPCTQYNFSLVTVAQYCRQHTTA